MRLVTTVEYQASDRREGGREEGGSNSSLSSLVRRECAGRGETWCAVTPSYPTARVEERVAACGQVLDSYRAVLSQDLALLGDNSASVISSEKDKERPWSWKVTVPAWLGSRVFAGVRLQEAAGLLQRPVLPGAGRGAGHRG